MPMVKFLTNQDTWLMENMLIISADYTLESHKS